MRGIQTEPAGLQLQCQGNHVAEEVHDDDARLAQLAERSELPSISLRARSENQQ